MHTNWQTKCRGFLMKKGKRSSSIGKFIIGQFLRSHSKDVGDDVIVVTIVRTINY